MKLKELYEKLYNKIFSLGFFKAFLKIPGLEKLLQYEVISYLFFGVMTTVVNFVVTALCNKLAGENYSTWVLFNIGAFAFKWSYAVQAIAWVFAVLFAYITNKLFVFESRSADFSTVIKEMASFFGARILSFFLFDELTFAVTEKLFGSLVSDKAAFWIAKCVAGVLVVIFNYIASKMVIFKKNKKKE